jgi:hypothetical protein
MVDNHTRRAAAYDPPPTERSVSCQQRRKNELDPNATPRKALADAREWQRSGGSWRASESGYSQSYGMGAWDPAKTTRHSWSIPPIAYRLEQEAHRNEHI